MNSSFINGLKRIRQGMALGVLVLGAFLLGAILLASAMAWMWFMATAFPRGWQSVMVMSLVIVIEGGMWIFVVRHIARQARMLFAVTKGGGSPQDNRPASWPLSLSIVAGACIPACAVFVMTPQQREAGMIALFVSLSVAVLLLVVLLVPSNLIHKFIEEREKNGKAT